MTKYQKKCVSYFVTSFSVVAAMLLILIKPNFKVPVSEHIGVSARTDKGIEFTKNSAVCDHMLVCDNIVSFEDFSVLANGTKKFRIKLQESLLIHRNGPQLNKTSDDVQDKHRKFRICVLLFITNGKMLKSRYETVKILLRINK